MRIIPQSNPNNSTSIGHIYVTGNIITSFVWTVTGDQEFDSVFSKKQTIMSANSGNVRFQAAKLTVPSNEAFIRRYVSLMLVVCDDRVASLENRKTLAPSKKLKDYQEKLTNVTHFHTTFAENASEDGIVNHIT